MYEYSDFFTTKGYVLGSSLGAGDATVTLDQNWLATGDFPTARRFPALVALVEGSQVEWISLDAVAAGGEPEYDVTRGLRGTTAQAFTTAASLRHGPGVFDVARGVIPRVSGFYYGADGVEDFGPRVPTQDLIYYTPLFTDRPMKVMGLGVECDTAGSDAGADHITTLGVCDATPAGLPGTILESTDALDLVNNSNWQTDEALGSNPIVHGLFFSIFRVTQFDTAPTMIVYDLAISGMPRRGGTSSASVAAWSESIATGAALPSAAASMTNADLQNRAPAVFVKLEDL